MYIRVPEKHSTEKNKNWRWFSNWTKTIKPTNLKKKKKRSMVPKQDQHKLQHTKVCHIKLLKPHGVNIFLNCFLSFFLFWWPHACWIQDQLLASTMSLWGWNGIRTQISSLGGRPCYPLSHVTGPGVKIFFKIFIFLTRCVWEEGYICAHKHRCL